MTSVLFASATILLARARGFSGSETQKNSSHNTGWHLVQSCTSNILAQTHKDCGLVIHIHEISGKVIQVEASRNLRSLTSFYVENTEGITLLFIWVYDRETKQVNNEKVMVYERFKMKQALLTHLIKSHGIGKGLSKFHSCNNFMRFSNGNLSNLCHVSWLTDIHENNVVIHR